MIFLYFGLIFFYYICICYTYVINLHLPLLLEILFSKKIYLYKFFLTDFSFFCQQIKRKSNNVCCCHSSNRIQLTLNSLKLYTKKRKFLYFFFDFFFLTYISYTYLTPKNVKKYAFGLKLQINEKKILYIIEKNIQWTQCIQKVYKLLHTFTYNHFFSFWYWILLLFYSIGVVFITFSLSCYLCGG